MGKTIKKTVCVSTGIQSGITWTVGRVVTTEGERVAALDPVHHSWTAADLRRDAVDLGGWEPAVGAVVPAEILAAMRSWRPVVES